MNNHANGGNTLPLAHDGNSDRATATCHFLTSDREAVLANFSQVFSQGFRVSNGLWGGLRKWLGKVLLNSFLGLIGKQYFAHTGGVQWKVASRAADGGDTAFTNQTVNIECLTAVENCKRHVLPRLFIEASQGGKSAFTQTLTQRRMLGNGPELGPYPETTIATLAQEATLFESAHYPVTGRHGKLGDLCDLRQGEGAVLGVKASKYLHGSFQQRCGCTTFNPCRAHQVVPSENSIS